MPPSSTVSTVDGSRDLSRCVHEARNALAAISSASEVLAQVELPQAVLHEAAVVVSRQVRQLSARMNELVDHAQRAAGEPGRALVVSDDAKLLAVLGGLLSDAGYRVDLAASSDDGYSALMNRVPEIAVVDVRTSTGSALSMGRRARDAGFEGRMVAVWGSSLAQHQQDKGGIAGFDAVLARTFEPAALRAAIA
ncbi:response regulator transcription factor [Variovorax sp. DXTD-1]|uniref:response regulator transcription factor n=1 Tax=Variovorax sp. DXTD-1 TaxID=2495592 RepID=UPI000F85CBFA|nr:response regulator transcription factor [Variovorax sp. DXTD-1]RST48574.1 response regulator transcription factor [Variovorax sp. DXTD-1]